MPPEIVISGDPSPVIEQAVPAEMAGAAVAVAEIQADRDVAIAEINAATTETVVMAATENEDDTQWLVAELEALNTRCAMLEGGLSSLEASQVAIAAQVGEMASGLASLLATMAAPSQPPTPSEPVTPQTLEMTAGEAAEKVDGQKDEAAAAPSAETPQRRRKWL